MGLNKHVGWTAKPKLITVWSFISMWLDFFSKTAITSTDKGPFFANFKSLDSKNLMIFIPNAFSHAKNIFELRDKLNKLSIFHIFMLLGGFFLKINKRVVPIKERVVGKIVSKRIGVWTWQLGTPEYMQ